MKHSLSQHLDSVDFHDSSIDQIERTDTSLSLFFDWAKISVKDSFIVVGKCVLILTDIRDEQIEPKSIRVESLGREFKLCLENSSFSDRDLTLSGMYHSEEVTEWVDWTIKFTSFNLTWDDSVTETEWKAGKLPS